jgi:hypothetical protein
MMLSTISIGAILLLMLIVPLNVSFAESQSTTTIVPLNDKLSLEETVLKMNIPADNVFPWAFVEGKIKNHASDYPVIIQFFNKQSDDPIHIAQVGVEDDGSYEYKLRVRDVDLDTYHVTRIFDGEYTVKVFKVVVAQDHSDSV